VEDLEEGPRVDLQESFCVVHPTPDSEDDAYAKLLAGTSLPDVKVLLSIFLILCMSSVPCETGFSVMAMVKTKLRNCLDTSTADALMMIALNGPALTDVEGCERILQAAKAHWKTTAKRCPKRSNLGKADRKKKAKAIRLSDLLLAKARDARERAGDGLPLCDEDDEPVDSGAESDFLEENEDLTAQLQAAVGPFSVPDGFQILPTPSWASQAAWASQCSKKFWVGKRLAHIAADGWHVSSFKKKYVGRGATREEGWLFYCKDTRVDCWYSLLTEDYGMTRAWVIIEKASGGDEEESYARQYTRPAGTSRRSA